MNRQHKQQKLRTYQLSHGWETTIKKDATGNRIGKTSGTVRLEDLQSTMDTLVKGPPSAKGAGR